MVIAVAVGCKRRAPIVPDQTDSDREACLVPPAVLRSAHEIGAGCALQVSTIVVGEGGRLVVRPGAKLTFSKGSALRVEGGILDIEGSKDAPVVLTADASAEWGGIAFPSSVLPVDATAYLSKDPRAPGPTTPPPLPVKNRSTIAHVVIEHASGEFGALGMQIPDPVHYDQVVPAPAAAISIIDEAQRVTMEDVTVGDSTSMSLYVAGYGDALEELKDSSFESKSEPSMVAGAMAIGRIRNTRFHAPIHTYGRVFESQKWTDPGVSLVLDRMIDVEALTGDEVVTLELGNGLVIVGSAFAGIELAREARGVRLVATNVQFLREPTEKFAWVPLSVPGRAYEHPFELTLRSCTFEKPKTLSIEALDWDKPTITIENTTFDHPFGPAIHVYNDCARFTDPARGNRSIGAPLCSTYMGPFE